MSEPHQSPISEATFRFSNVGPVKDAALKLGRLTVIAGRNNTGKTYITYALYGFLKSWMNWETTPIVLENTLDDFPSIAAITNNLYTTGHSEVSVSPSELARQRTLLSRKIGQAFSSQFRDVFNSRRDSFRDAELMVDIDSLTLNQLPSRATLRFGPHTISISYNGENIIADLSSSEGSVIDSYSYGDAPAMAYVIFLMRDVFPHPFILSAERFGISLFYRELDFTKNQLVDLLQKYANDTVKRPPPYWFIDQTTSRYAMPIKDNIDFTRSIPDLPRDPSPLASHKLFDDVKNMMQGYYSNANDDIRFISKARKRGRFNIPLHLASSSVRGLSDLYFYLRYSAHQGQLLIIDEPESHLDTSNQIQFARLLSRFVGSGLHVVITTHSDYIVKELNNLIMLSRDIPDKKKVSKQLGYCPEDELMAGYVRGYVAENGGLTACQIGPYGIEMPVFDITIDDISRAAIELSSRTAEATTQ